MNPEFETALSGKALKIPKNQLNRNGNIEPYVFLANQRKVRVLNTCPFDSIVTNIANAYIQIDSYRTFINSSENLLLKTAKSLAVNGANKDTYKLRAEALSKVFQPKRQLPSSKTKIFPSVVYDAYENLVTLIKIMLSNSPSLVFQTVYLDASCKCTTQTNVHR